VIKVQVQVEGERNKQTKIKSSKFNDTALGYKLDDRWFESRQRLRVFIFTTDSIPALGPTQPPIQWVAGTLSLGVKRQGREADHSLPTSAEVMNTWSYIYPLPQYAFMAWCSVKAQGLLYL
jgi:hypothetical protein